MWMGSLMLYSIPLTQGTVLETGMNRAEKEGWCLPYFIVLPVVGSRF
jgi:hypothetical protein